MSLIQLFSERLIKIELDPAIQGNLKPQYQNLNQVNLPIRLIDLLKSLGCVQPRRVNPTFLKSLLDYGYLLEYLYNTPELKLKIQDTRELLGSEMLQEMSELMGIGLSVAVISKLCDIQQSTINKIIGVPSIRPDWTCYLKNGESLLVEAKGTIDKDKSKQQLKKALNQKNSWNGDVKLAASTILNETTQSIMKIIDPPTLTNDNFDNMKRHMYRANHYASVFSFLGDEVLCLYFEKMAKRLSKSIANAEMDDKESMYHELINHTPFVKIGGKKYSGHLYRIENDQFLYIGVDTNLLSYYGFMAYQEAEEEKQISRNGNQYFVHTDGVLLVDVIEPEYFMSEHQIESIGVSMDQIALTDIDSIRGNSFKRYVKYLLEKCFKEVRCTETGSLKVVEKGYEMEYFVYHVRNAKFYSSQRQTDRIINLMKDRQGILVTNLDCFPKSIFKFPCIDRTDFRLISDLHAKNEVVNKIFNTFNYRY